MGYAFTFDSRVKNTAVFEANIKPTSVRLYAAKKETAKKETAKKEPKKKPAAKKETAKEEVISFKKAEFVASIAEKTGFSKADSSAALAAVFEVISEEVADGKRVPINGFGTFKLSKRAGRKGRNPKTGEEIEIKPSNTPAFTASKIFKEKVNPGR